MTRTMAEQAYPRPRVPLFSSGDPALAERIDEVLAEGFGEDSCSTPVACWRHSTQAKSTTPRRPQALTAATDGRPFRILPGDSRDSR